MKYLNFKNLVFALTCLGALQNGVNAGEDTYQIKFLAEINGSPLKCGQSYSGVGSTSAEVTPTDFRMYVSNISLQNAQGIWVKAQLVPDGIWQTSLVALIDFEDGSGPCRNGTAPTNTAIKIKAPGQPYQAIRFELGVPFELNHANPTVAQPPLSSTSLFWNWQNGYRFIKFDARVAPQGYNLSGKTVASGFSFHLGSTECASPSASPAKECKNPNRVAVELKNYDPLKNSLVVDIARILTKTDLLSNTPQTSPGCMSFPGDPDCTGVMSLIGLPYQGIATNTSQKLISVR